MRVLVAPDKLKGALDAAAAARAIERGATSVASSIQVRACPVADGGDGTLRALLAPLEAVEQRCSIHAANGAVLTARWGYNSARKLAVIESAEAVGIARIPRADLDPLRTSSYGLGELLLSALDAGAERIVIGLGGSATSDGGAGMAQALGARLAGANVPATGADLARVVAIDTALLDPRLRRTELVVACDVDSPLTGPDGAALLYAPQKGASDATARELDRALAHFAAFLPKVDPSAPRTGAAGGLGFALAALCGASLVAGAELVLDSLGFDALLSDVDLVITAEGKLDRQSRRGKAVAAVARRASDFGVPCVALVGELALELNDLAELGLASAFSICSGPMSLEQAMGATEQLLESTAARVVSAWHRARASGAP